MSESAMRSAFKEGDTAVVHGSRGDRWVVFFLVLAIALLLGAGIHEAQLRMYDEPREAELARAMLRSGDYAVTHLGGHAFLEKPPLFSASVAFVWKLLGWPSLMAGRIVAAAWAALAVIALYLYARRALGVAGGLVAAALLATTYRFAHDAQTFFLDDALVACVTGATVLAHVAIVERRRRLATLAAFVLALGFLVKGGIAIVLVGLTLVTDLILRRDFRGVRVFLRPLPIAALLLPIALWTVALYGEGGWNFLRVFYIDNHWGRFVHGYESMRTDGWYYVPKLIGSTLPWTILMPFAAICTIGLLRHAREPVPRASGRVKAADAASLALAWTVPAIILLSISRARSGSYLLPLMPGFALLAAILWSEVIAPGQLGPLGRRAVGIWGIAMAVGAVGVSATLFVLGRDAIAAVGLGGTLIGAWMLLRSRLEEPRAAFALLAVAAAALTAGSGRYVSHRMNERLSLDPIVAGVWKRVGDRQLLLYHPRDSWSGYFAFRADREVPEIFSAGRLLERLEKPPRSVALADVDNFRRLPETERKRFVIETQTSRRCRRTFILFRARRPAVAENDLTQ